MNEILTSSKSGGTMRLMAAVMAASVMVTAVLVVREVDGKSERNRSH